MFGALALVTVREKKDEAGGKIPLIFAGADELIDDDLRAVGEIAELGFPKDEGFGIVAAETIFEADTSGFRERRIVDFAEGLVAREVRERDVVVFVFGVDQNGVALMNVPRWVSWPVRRTGVPSRTSEPSARASAKP